MGTGSTINGSLTLIKDLHLLTMKPVLYVCNVSEETATMSEPPHKAKDLDPHIVVSAQIEQEVSGLPDSEQGEYLVSLGFDSSGLDRLIKKTYHMLGLISFLTAGEKEVRAWTIEKDTKAPKAAGTIHSDIERGFIKAEVVSFDELVQCGTRDAARTKGKLRLEGKEYIVQDGDVVEFKFSA
jgi:ribosome-binding ATPase